MDNKPRLRTVKKTEFCSPTPEPKLPFPSKTTYPYRMSPQDVWSNMAPVGQPYIERALFGDMEVCGKITVDTSGFRFVIGLTCQRLATPEFWNHLAREMRLPVSLGFA